MAVWTHIAHDSLSLPAALVTWSSISGSYDHLYCQASMRTDESAYYTAVNVRVGNGSLDDGTNYSTSWLAANTSTAPWGWRQSGIAYWTAGYTSAASAQASTFGTMRMWIPRYAGTTAPKQAMIQTHAATQSNTNERWLIAQAAALWKSNSAIDTISIYPANDDLIAGCVFDLYGITGA